MRDEHDAQTIRCRRLGHEVPFGYCRREAGHTPCRLLLNCWWEQFDVQAFVREHFAEDVVKALEEARSSPAPPKMLSLLEILEQARRRLASPPEPAPMPEEPLPSPREPITGRESRDRR